MLKKIIFFVDIFFVLLILTPILWVLRVDAMQVDIYVDCAKDKD